MATPSLLLFSFLSLILSLSNSIVGSSHLKPALVQAPVPVPVPEEAPTLDCSAYIDGTLSCIEFIEQGSNVTEVDSNCCTTLKKIVSEKLICLCALLTANESDLGLKINSTRVLTLPHDCKFMLPTASQCSSFHRLDAIAPAVEPSGSKGLAAVASPPTHPLDSLAVALPITVFIIVAGITVSMLPLIA